MSDLRIDAMVPKLANDSGEAAARAEELGFDGVWTPEMDNDAFLPHPVIANRTEEIQQGTRIALSFTRSPMALAYTAWDLAQYTDGRFVLGLGTQVKGHNERRFSIDWESPGPRLREVVESLRHIFDVFQGEADLDYEGDHYSFSLMTDNFNPGPIDHPDVPIYIAGVNEYNIRLAGELCDGLDMHVFNTPGYTDDVIAPTVAEGADRGERSLEDVALSASPFVVTGETEDEREQSRREVRRRIAFYGSTRTYHDVLEHHGWKSVGEELHELSKDGKWEEMADLVTDEMVSTFAIEAPPEELLAEARAVYGGIADRVVLPLDHGEAFLNE
ncbi:TIGR03617 family F420-dependent LLM class oxidoreductase [Natrinema thermotolerans]|uniref:TIGR03617 family F420-dependent LLM class oxidoreductase n=1 Tax=Natrinema thermotolerans TaxID=121872 RepID=A0AAF0PED5_9EURY|nr:TIGR03617 family F420-dependent LLM class oxidoreductase [Natrinema thermotolerans]QCC58566.1 TIGR03617 family F420-dependent LLM class oxidoreductase [Natrinema thermotolerans]WMT09702.1 TIGR03617 family F420-dependent LLM class oxidoreductase [Natrinema thermotolerans]